MNNQELPPRIGDRITFQTWRGKVSRVARKIIWCGDKYYVEVMNNKSVRAIKPRMILEIIRTGAKL